MMKSTCCKNKDCFDSHGICLSESENGLNLNYS